MRPLSKRDRARLMLAASLLAPIVCVQGVRLLLGAGPAGASASVAATPAAAPTLPIGDARPRPLTPAQQQAAAWLAEYAHVDAEGSLYADLRSPMDHPAPPPPTPEQATPSAKNPQPTRPMDDPGAFDPRRDLHVSSIMVDREHAVAFINGSLSRVGDSAHGWTITHIDGKRRVVVLRNEQGDEVELSPPMP